MTVTFKITALTHSIFPLQQKNLHLDAQQHSLPYQPYQYLSCWEKICDNEKINRIQKATSKKKQMKHKIMRRSINTQECTHKIIILAYILVLKTRPDNKPKKKVVLKVSLMIS